MRQPLLLPLALIGGLFLLVSLSLPAQDEPPASGAPSLKHNPQAHARLALDFLRSATKHKQFSPPSACDIRFLSWLGVPDRDLPVFKKVLNVWLNNMSFEKAPSLPRDVPGSDGRLQWISLDWYRWNSDAFRAVAERDRTFREPWVDCRIGEALRQRIHVEPKKVATVHGYCLTPLEAIVWAPQLFRDTIETDRQPSYYDLLFARQRFGDYRLGQGTTIENHILRLGQQRSPQSGLGKAARLDFNVPADAVITVDGAKIQGTSVTTPPLPVLLGSYEVKVQAGTRTALGSIDVAPGQRTTVTWLEPEGDSRQKRLGFVDRDFPRDSKDWDRAFGIDVSQLFEGKEDLSLEQGAVIEGGRDNPRGGSIVTLNNRLIVDEPGALHGMRTFDVFKTAGDKDYLENAPKLPALFRKQKIAFDASELLNYLPNGGQAGFLTDGAGQRAEIAANKAADGKNASPRRLSPGVRNPGDCVICHAPSGGYILPTNLIKQVLENGIDFKFRDPADEVKFRGFYLGWDKRVKAWQEPFHDLVAECTKEPLPTVAEWEAAGEDGARLEQLQARAAQVKKAKGWTSAEYAKHFAAFREWYDGPMATSTLAAELGVPVEVMKRLAANPVFKEAEHKLPVRNTVRLSGLVRDLPTPRSVFDEDLYPILGLLLYEKRANPQEK